VGSDVNYQAMMVSGLITRGWRVYLGGRSVVVRKMEDQERASAEGKEVRPQL
jgi:hypothetical protein